MKVSILSAVHNEERHLAEMIRSVQAQTHTEWELLLVSDGSVDRTVAIAQEFADADRRVIVVGDGAKVGKVAAFNAAYEASTGDVVVLLGGDDTLTVTSLAHRAGLVEDHLAESVVAYSKLRTMSDDAQHDGLVLPRGDSGAHSGGTMALTRTLARQIFPIDPTLVAEDLWLSHAADALADRVVESTTVVLNYRIHPGNSNPRQRSFAEMDRAMAARHRAWAVLLATTQFVVSGEHRRRLEVLTRLESLRAQRKVLALLLYRDAGMIERLAFISQSNAALFWLRKRFFRVLSGRRRR